MKKVLFAVALALVSLAGTAQDLKANMDASVNPGDDFWQYAVGGWLKANPLDKQHVENGAARPMIDTWYQAFKIKKNVKMYIPKEKRAQVW